MYIDSGKVNTHKLLLENIVELIMLSNLPPTSTWPHLKSDVGLEEGEY